MDRDVGQFIGLIAVASGAVVLVLSYLGAYMIGRSHGRRAEEHSPRNLDQLDATQRIAAVESSIYGLSASIDRLMDAQRLLVAQQDHLSRKVGLADRNDRNNAVAIPAIQSKTPS
jgi:ABC-type protease/lipase transport system fused ATPase/permease subunit